MNDQESRGSKIMSAIHDNHRYCTMKVQDRELSVLCELDENVFRLSVAPSTGGDDHFLRIEFTKGLAQELKAFLAEHLSDNTEPLA